MDAIEAILTRRSIRNFTDCPIEPVQIELLLKAAMCAPSAANEQPWRFLVITDKTRFPEIIRHHPYAQMLKTASLAILVCGDLECEKVAGNWVLDCSCAAENMLLAAHAIGLGAVWAGIYPEEDRSSAFTYLFSLPEQIIPFALIGIGCPKETELSPSNRFKPEKVFLNRWGNAFE